MSRYKFSDTVKFCHLFCLDVKFELLNENLTYLNLNSAFNFKVSGGVISLIYLHNLLKNVQTNYKVKRFCTNFNQFIILDTHTYIQCSTKVSETLR